MQLATFTLSGRTYGVDVTRVQELLRNQPCTRVPLAPSDIAGLINLRGEVLVAFDLRQRLELPAAHAAREPMVMVVRGAEENVALLVDEFGSVITVDDADFEPPPDTLTGKLRDYIVGVYKLPGQLLLSLDLDRTIAVA